ncbi:cell cycle checkpoint control protein rad9a [Bulinus truncatus]|nr:cell cycle checkpoint control protein rad9a [Bulinus truncatus]
MSTMNCTIPGVSLKVFGRAIQSLSKIGDELYFEPLEDGLFLRSVNSCRSAYACFKFTPNFFINYASGSSKGAINDDDALRCKVGMKSIMTVFRSLATIDKTVEKCTISLNMTDARLVFQMYCRHGIIKTHNLAFIECETLQAVYSKELCPNKFTAPPKLLCEAVLNFQNNQEEITLIIRPDYLALKNYVEDETDSSKIMHTELTLSPDEFESYRVGVDSDVTFCLREMRAVLSFCDLTGLPLIAQFEEPGRPITFSVTSDPSFEANFVLATLADTEPLQHSQRSQVGSTAGKASSSKKSYLQNGASSSKKSYQHEHNTQSKHKPGSSRAIFDDDNEFSSVMMDVTVPEDSFHPAGNQSQVVTDAAKVNRREDLGQRLSKEADEDSETDPWRENYQLRTNQHKYRTLSLNAQSADIGHRPKNYDTGGMCTTTTPTLQKNLSLTEGTDLLVPSVSRKQLCLKSARHSDAELSPVILLQDSVMVDPLSEDEENDEDEIPGTPPSKKFRSVFFGTQSSTQASQSQKRVQVLAPDSDPE